MSTGNVQKYFYKVPYWLVATHIYYGKQISKYHRGFLLSCSEQI